MGGEGCGVGGKAEGGKLKRKIIRSLPVYNPA